MPDKTPHQSVSKKSVKTIKEKRAEKKAKHVVDAHTDPVAHIKKRWTLKGRKPLLPALLTCPPTTRGGFWAPRDG